MAHYTLARSLVPLGRTDDAVEATRRAVGFNPNFPAAHALLARLLRPDDPSGADEHLSTAREIRSKRLSDRRARRQSTSGGWTPPKIETPTKPKAKMTAPQSGEQRKPPTEPVWIVTGLPRSGTSMAMQMLQAAGIEALTDGVRVDDVDNPHGYLELEAIKRTAADPSWLYDAGGRAAKVVAPLLPHLPGGLDYRVLLMERDLDEVLESQRKMLDRTGRAGADLAPARLKAAFSVQLERAMQWIASQAANHSLVISFAEAHGDARGTAERVAAFVGDGCDPETIAAAIDPSLHRSRVG